MRYFKIVCVAALCLCAVKTFANVSVYPYAVEFDSAKGKRVIPIRVTNPTSIKKTYRISIMDVRQTIDGGYDEITAEEGRPQFSAAPFITFSPRQFTLEPHDYQTVNIGRKPLLNVPDGDYVSRIRVEEVDTPSPQKQPEEMVGFSVDLKFLYVVTIPVYIKKGTTPGRANIVSAKVQQFNDGKYYLMVMMEREGGPRYLRGRLTATADKKQIAELKNTRIYPDNPARLARMPLDPKVVANPKDLIGKKIKIVFKNDNEKNSLGEAEFTLTENDIILLPEPEKNPAVKTAASAKAADKKPDTPNAKSVDNKD